MKAKTTGKEMGIGYGIHPVLILSLLLWFTRVFAGTKSYVVYLGGHSHGPDATLDDFKRATDMHYNVLGGILGSLDKVESSLIYSYTKNINGFAAYLTDEEAEQIAKRPDVVSVFPNSLRNLHTVKSWEFMGLEKEDTVTPQSIWKPANYGQDVIIANLDTGVWPESKSFDDEGFGPVPTRWKGYCEKVNNSMEEVKCNRKLIGARYFSKGRPEPDRYHSARDIDGHGTHTLSTAAGRAVPGANVFRVANGTAKGGSPGSRAAAYRVCQNDGCYDADILAAFDAAIHDGADVISVSLGGFDTDYFTSALAIGSFHAVLSGISVVASGGNDGPYPFTVTNTAPWLITVAAGSDGRALSARVSLGNGIFVEGSSLASKHLPPRKNFPLVDSANCRAANATEYQARYCQAESLDPNLVEGKIVVCLRGENGRMEKAAVVSEAGGVGMILANDANFGDDVSLDAFMIPAVHLTYKAGSVIYSYLNSTKSPVGRIGRPRALFGFKPAPSVALFSSRGPGIVSPKILKPDILAPGVNILAAYSEGATATTTPNDTRRVAFNILSGTSMACPHVSGVAGLLKAIYPHWSPSAIKSAIMTTARTRDNTRKGIKDSFMGSAGPLDYGAGHVQPNRAANPGLVYDLSAVDYMNFLCSLGYNASTLAPFTYSVAAGSGFACPKSPPLIEDFNYPSITWHNLTGPVKVSRTLKNVDRPGTYTAHVRSPAGVSIDLKPEVLKFEEVGQELTFQITATPIEGMRLEHNVFGYLTWKDGTHVVRSPLSVLMQENEYSALTNQLTMKV